MSKSTAELRVFQQKQIEETARQIKQVNKQLGELGNKFGSCTEGMAFPSMEKILRNHFKMDVVALRAKSRQNGHSIEIDVMTIEQFPKFFGAHRDRKIYGVIAAVNIPDNLCGEVLSKGLYLARIHDGTFELLTPREFKPKAFGPAGKQNGTVKKGQPRKK